MTAPSDAKSLRALEEMCSLFQQAVAAATRAIAHDTAVDISGDSLSRDGRALEVLPLPERGRLRDIAAVRGSADALALTHHYHDPDLHQKLRPGSQPSRELFDAIEQIRVEAIGAREMPGVRANLGALQEKRVLEAGPAKRESSLTLPVVLGLVVRERLIGDPPPDAIKAATERQRRALESRLGHLLDSLAKSLEDQRQSSLISLRLIEQLVVDCFDSFDDNPAPDRKSVV